MNNDNQMYNRIVDNEKMNNELKDCINDYKQQIDDLEYKVKAEEMKNSLYQQNEVTRNLENSRGGLESSRVLGGIDTSRVLDSSRVLENNRILKNSKLMEEQMLTLNNIISQKNK